MDTEENKIVLTAAFWKDINKKGPVPQQRPELGHCWLRKGYALGVPNFVKIRGRKVRSHHVVYKQYVGPLLEGHIVVQLCGEKACVNPSHLEQVSHTELNKSKAKKREFCKYGHPFIPENRREVNGGKASVCIVCEQEALQQRKQEKQK